MTPRSTPKHRVLVVPWLRWPMQRFVLPNWTAITIGPLIFAWRRLDTVELAHELKHVEQWRRHGPAFAVLYLLASRSAVKAGGHRYFDNRFEREAIAAGESERVRVLASWS
jgi:hypothetical protein